MTIIVEGMTYEIGFMSPKECQNLIQDALERGLTRDFRSTSSVDFRSGVAFSDTHETEKIRERAREIHQGCDYVESVEVVKYETGASYRLHTDGHYRKHSLLVYLNEDYQGGETVFPHLDIEVKGPTGALLAWQNSKNGISDQRFAHRVAQITEGVKWIAICWTR